MPNGDVVTLMAIAFKCSEGECAQDDAMLTPSNISGTIQCVDDAANCVIDGERERGVMRFEGRSQATHHVIIRAITFKDGQAVSGGGGIYAEGETTIDVILCRFVGGSDSTFSKNYGGGGIYILNAYINIYATEFIGNEALGRGGIFAWVSPMKVQSLSTTLFLLLTQRSRRLKERSWTLAQELRVNFTLTPAA
ncbi:hypothetical protein TrLO_g10799 [Triparma laevis f. longispina]|uniref:Uncharacterized protein n=1 Tax=Triparma laevis f. longispina TaxID=1714387 RepID=A0A9W7FQN1_9STRA|nr:hypothetical protein TrLO_g10799 [Triparma laevis f. longispina]